MATRTNTLVVSWFQERTRSGGAGDGTVDLSDQAEDRDAAAFGTDARTMVYAYAHKSSDASSRAACFAFAAAVDRYAALLAFTSGLAAYSF